MTSPVGGSEQAVTQVPGGGSGGENTREQASSGVAVPPAPPPPAAPRARLPLEPPDRGDSAAPGFPTGSSAPGPKACTPHWATPSRGIDQPLGFEQGVVALSGGGSQTETR